MWVLGGSYFLTVAKENISLLFASLLGFLVISVCLIYLAFFFKKTVLIINKITWKKRLKTKSLVNARKMGVLLALATRCQYQTNQDRLEF